MNRHLLYSVLLAVSVCAVSSAVCAQPTYRITPIGTNDSITSTTATGLNDAGELAVTVSSSDQIPRAVLWRDGTMTDLGDLGASQPFAESAGLNDLTQVVGTTLSPETGHFQGFLWSHGQMLGLPTPPGKDDVFAISINLLGQIAGETYGPQRLDEQMIVWDHGHILPLAPLPGGDGTGEVRSINILGEVVGWSAGPNNSRSAVIWRRGIPSAILPDADAKSVNDLGDVVGVAGADGFLWQNGQVSKLPRPAGYLASSAADINDWGQIVGSAGSSPYTPESAILWQNGSVFDLNLLTRPMTRSSRMSGS